MSRINIGKPIDTTLIRCCSCHKGYEIKGNLYDGNILICPHCGLKHRIDFKLFDKRIENLKRLNKLNLTVIDIGSGAINRGNTIGGYTLVMFENPANATGTLTSIEIWAATEMTNCQVATFFVVSGDNLSTRDSVTLGTITAGSKQTITVDSGSNPISLDVQTGDYLGVYIPNGTIEYDDSLQAGMWYLSGDYIPCTNQLFSSVADDAVSVYATGETAGADFEYAGTGSFAFSGSATYILGLTYSGTGSLAYSGTATQVHSKDYLFTGSGSLGFSGSAIVIIGLTYTGQTGKWSGLGMGMYWHWDSYVDFLLGMGFTELRMDIPSYDNDEWLGFSKTAVIDAVGKGADVIWGISYGGTLTAANWGAYVTACESAATWAQANGVFEFQLGNELDGLVDGTTLTVAQLITNLKALATDVQVIFTNGNVSYTCYGNNIGDWVTAGKGDIDILASNLYMTWGEAGNPDDWQEGIDALIGAFGTEGTYLTEFSINTNGLEYYSENEAVQAAALTEMIDYIKASGMTRAIFYVWKDDEPAHFGVKKADDSYRLLWSSLLNSFTFLGAATTTIGFSYSGTGSLAFSGSAICALGFAYTASGSLAFSGEGTYVLGFSYVASESFTFSGTATQSYQRAFFCTAAGNFNFSGTGGYIVEKDYVYVATGSFIFSGTATQIHTYNYPCVASGTFIYSGTASCSFGVSYIGTGSFNYSGSAECEYTVGVNFVYVSVSTGMGWLVEGWLVEGWLFGGVFIYSGSAECEYIVFTEFEYTGSGSLSFSGTATQVHTRYYLYSGSGEFTYSGSGVVEKSQFIFVGGGELIYSGEASAIYHYGWVEIDKKEANYNKIEPEESIWIEIDKEESNYNKIEKE